VLLLLMANGDGYVIVEVAGRRGLQGVGCGGLQVFGGKREMDEQ
nr:hypothetical protein [Tanacetum cinerariifolium]